MDRRAKIGDVARPRSLDSPVNQRLFAAVHPGSLDSSPQLSGRLALDRRIPDRARPRRPRIGRQRAAHALIRAAGGRRTAAVARQGPAADFARVSTWTISGKPGAGHQDRRRGLRAIRSSPPRRGASPGRPAPTRALPGQAKPRRHAAGRVDRPRQTRPQDRPPGGVDIELVSIAPHVAFPLHSAQSSELG